MPKRTNPFQQLVHMIESALAPMGAKITESAMENGREIDVLIESELGQYNMKIAVEAKNEKCPLDVGTIEQYIGKYQVGGIPVNQVVVVSSSGFTHKARKKAALNNIKLLTLEEAEQSDWTKLAQQVVFKIGPYINSVELIPSVASKNGKDPLADGRFVEKCNVNDCLSPHQWANWLLQEQVLKEPEFLAWLDTKAKQFGGMTTISFRLPMTNYMLAFEGEQHPVELIVHISCASSTGPVKWSSYKQSAQDKPSKTIDQMEVQFGKHRMRAVFPNGPKSGRINVRIDAMPPDTPDISPELPKEMIAINIRPADISPLHTPPAFLTKQLMSQFRPQGSGPHSSAPKKKIGRKNDPCPCGSGKKFKYCCLQKN